MSSKQMKEVDELYEDPLSNTEAYKLVSEFIKKQEGPCSWIAEDDVGTVRYMVANDRTTLKLTDFISFENETYDGFVKHTTLLDDVPMMLMECCRETFMFSSHKVARSVYKEAKRTLSRK